MAIRQRFARPVKRLAVHKFGSSATPPINWLDHSKSPEERDRLMAFHDRYKHIPPIPYHTIPRVRNPRDMRGEFAIGVVYWRPDMTYSSWVLVDTDLNEPDSYKHVGVSYKFHQAWDKVIAASDWHPNAAHGGLVYLGDGPPLRFAENNVKGLLERPKKW